jgi:hypothetical protein
MNGRGLLAAAAISLGAGCLRLTEMRPVLVQVYFCISTTGLRGKKEDLMVQGIDNVGIGFQVKDCAR